MKNVPDVSQNERQATTQGVTGQTKYMISSDMWGSGQHLPIDWSKYDRQRKSLDADEVLGIPTSNDLKAFIEFDIR